MLNQKIPQRNISRHVNFREFKDPYSSKSIQKMQRKRSVKEKRIEIDKKFESSSEDSDSDRRPIKRIVVHKNNIFGKLINSKGYL